MNSTDYHLLKSHISKSALDVFHESPYKYWWKYLSGKYVEETTKTFDFGKASHGFVLEPNKWNEEFVVSPTFKGDGSMKRRENFKETHSDKTIISMSEYETLKRMRDVLENDRTVRDLLFVSDKIVEKSFFWQNPETGIFCKCRPDQISKQIIGLDYKTTEDASTNGFPYHAKKYRYRNQAAIYSEGLLHNGIELDAFIFIAQEKKPPYLVNYFYATNDTLANGRESFLKDLEDLKICRETNTWPMYGNDIKPLEL